MVKKAAVSEGGFHTGCTWKAGRCKGRLNAALISELGWATGANSMSLVKMRGITLIFNSNHASLSSLTEEFWFFNKNLDIPQILQKFVIFHLEVLQHFLKLLLIYSTLLSLSSLPTDQLDYILCDKMWAIFWEPLFTAQKDSTTGTWALESRGWSRL